MWQTELANIRLRTVTGVFLAGIGLTGLAVQLAAPELVGASDSSVRQADIDIAMAATLRLTARGCETQVTGSGFALSFGSPAETVIVTNKHIVTDAIEAKVDQPIRPVVSPVLASSQSVDLGSVAPVGSIALEISDAIPETGDFIAAIGHPGGHEARALESRVQLVTSGESWGQAARVMLFEAHLVPGFSGGPVIGADGGVVAIVSGYSESTGLGVAILAEDLETWLAAEPADLYKFPPQAGPQCAE